MAGNTVLVVGSSDGIGLALVRRLLAQGYRVLGISRSPSVERHAAYLHVECDVTSTRYQEVLNGLIASEGHPSAVVYCAAIAGRSTPTTLGLDLAVFDVNLLGAVRTAECVVPHWSEHEKGRFIVLSSQADGIINPESPSYTASKAAVSQYFEGLSLRMRKSGVSICVVRFGFVATKLARAGFQPGRISTDVAAAHLQKLLLCPKLKPRDTYPKRVIPIVLLATIVQRLRVFWG